MARWDEILTLPVQNPPTLEFSSADIVWSRVEGWRETVDRLALIPFSRVNDFVRGESNRKECPTRFHVEARRRRSSEMPYKPKVDGILEYVLYWCSFGPDDHRKGGIVRPSRNYSTKRKTPAGRPNTKRGCDCRFIVKRLIAQPSVALIIYNHDKHVDKQGLPCHGPQDKKSVGTRAMFAPYISEELRLQVMSLLYVGVPVETIMQRHSETVEKQGGPCNRDDLLTHRYVRRLERKIRRSTYELDADDAVSTGMWIESHQNHVFFYEDFSDSEPFVLGIQTEWQLQQMIRFGNRSLVASDSRFGTNKLKYPVHSLLVFDSNNNAIPAAWIITPQFAAGDMHRWLKALYDRVHTKDPTWKLGGFIVDDPSADVHTIREVFQCSVLICFWRVRHAWHKNLIEKCSETDMRIEISRRLGRVISNICREGGSMDLFEDFLEDFVDCTDFLDYFKAIWVPRLGLWIAALNTLPLVTVETSAAIECYHHQLKLRLLNEKDPSVYQRADWLVDKLGTTVHSYYWLDVYTGKENFARYWKDEWKSGLTSWRQAAQIPDSDVIVESRCAKINSQKNKDKVHIVCNPGTEFAICDCSWSRMGNLCKHVIKASRVYRDRGLAAQSISLFEYNRTLINILHCPPHDSLMRDHAVVLAVCVQKQLNSLFDLESSRDTPSTSVPVDHQIAADGNMPAPDILESGDNELRRESLFVNVNDNAGETATIKVSDSGTESIQTSHTDPESTFASTLRSPPCSEVVGKACTSQVSDVLGSEKEMVDFAGHCLDSMIVDSMETSNNVSHDSSKKPVICNDSRENIAEKISLDQVANGVETESGVHNAAEDDYNKVQGIGVAAVGNNRCGDVGGEAVVYMDIDGSCNNGEKAVLCNTVMNVSDLDFRSSSAAAKTGCQGSDYVCKDQVTDVTVSGESACADIVEEADPNPMSEGVVAIHRVSVKAPEGISTALVTSAIQEEANVNSGEGAYPNAGNQSIVAEADPNPMSDGAVAIHGVSIEPPEGTGKAVVSPAIGDEANVNTGDGANPDAEDQYIVVDTEISATATDIDKDVGMIVANHDAAASDGSEEKLRDGIGIQNMSLVRCSMLRQEI